MKYLILVAVLLSSLLIFSNSSDSSYAREIFRDDAVFVKLSETYALLPFEEKPLKDSIVFVYFGPRDKVSIYVDNELYYSSIVPPKYPSGWEVTWVKLFSMKRKENCELYEVRIRFHAKGEELSVLLPNSCNFMRISNSLNYSKRDSIMRETVGVSFCFTRDFCL